MAGMTRFVGVPRAVLNAEIGDSVGWRDLGRRMLAHVKEVCPVSDGDGTGPHLRDTLVANFIGGGDPRVLIGSQTKGDVLTYLTEGTEDHDIPPPGVGFVPKGGSVAVWARHVSGIQPDPFVINACREVASEL